MNIDEFSRVAVGDSCIGGTLILQLADFQTHYHGVSIKLYEYQVAGKPIICYSNGLPKTYVDETNSGISIRLGDALELIEVCYLDTNVNIYRGVATY